MNRSLVTTALALGLFGLVVLTASADPTSYASGAERRADWTLTITLPTSNTGTGKGHRDGDRLPWRLHRVLSAGHAREHLPDAGGELHVWGLDGRL